MLSLDVFSVLLLKRHGIYMVFEAFSTANCQQQRVPKSSKISLFWLISGGVLLGAILASFWPCFGRFWGAFLDPCFQESAPQRTRISLNRAQSRPNRFQFGPILPLLCPTQPKSLNQSQIRPNRPHISPNQPESATRAKHFQRKGRE